MSEATAVTRTRRPGLAAAGLATTLVLWAGLAGGVAHAARFTEQFSPEDCVWSHRGRQNPYFSLKPGYQLRLEGEEDGALITVHVTVLRQTERITFTSPSGNQVTVRARVVEEREWEDGELVEVSRNWFARCVQTSDVFYFGEEVDDYEDGEIVGHGGAWRAGVDGAQPGIIMPGRFLLGAKYYQEIASGVALDRASHVGMGLDVGDFQGCVSVKETTPLEPDAESFKVYCPGVGLVIDDVVELVGFGLVPPE